MATILPTSQPIFSDGPEVSLRKYCLDHASRLNPKDAGDLIKKAAGIYSWLTANSTTEKTLIT